ncbi:hypothetical protein PR048_011367 [Dryococelus australis]|uniref:Uncharacterized protein n=1 Tax=Dryococelus australis TaxID=614101 RepID=A0ABQ9HM61_9NEOP|nr:hypothetical protein PR048_011367 [Dryococelus australis]
MLLADLLLRECVNEWYTLEYDNSVKGVVHSLRTEVFLKDTRIKEFQEETKKDEQNQYLKRHHNGFDLASALLEYYNLHTSSLEMPPAQLLMSIKLQTKLPKFYNPEYMKIGNNCRADSRK